MMQLFLTTLVKASATALAWTVTGYVMRKVLQEPPPSQYPKLDPTRKRL